MLEEATRFVQGGQLEPADWLPADTALTFAQPWLLLLLLALPLLAYLRGQRGPAAALIFSSTTVLRGLGKLSTIARRANFCARCFS